MHLIVLHTCSQFNYLLKIVSTRKKEGQNKIKFSRLDETVNDFVIGNGTTVKAMGNEGLESQPNGYHEDFERSVYSASQNQVIGSNTDNRIRNPIDSAVIAVANHMHDAILTAMNNVLFPRVEMAVRSIEGSSGNGPNSLFQNPDRRDFTGNTENAPLTSASSRLDSNFEQDEIDETRDIDNSEDGDFPVTRFYYDRRAHAHHMVAGRGCHAHHNLKIASWQENVGKGI